MKKYLFFTAFAAAAFFLSGCQNDRTTTVIYTDVPSPLTQMTFRESLPPETYSEYMATYTPESETSSGRYQFTMIGGNGIYADTRVTAPPVNFGGGVGALKRDTAVTTTVPVTETDESEETVTCVPIESETDISETSQELTEQTEQTEVPEPAETTKARTLVRPKADTGVTARVTRVSADTSHTSSSSETETNETESSAE
ncbi:MAG: hypothetical protein K2N60_06410 [Oscillospiraceae bacterium]|nr:hypothetical protein [Oscillospiraceae bacterium]